MQKINDGAYILTDPLEAHPCALIMPAMAQDEFDKFKEDISGNGLLEPIVLCDGKILDGLNRYRACIELGIDVWVRDWEGGMDPVAYVVSKNIHRRQLTVTQKADCAAKAITFWSSKAKERQRVAGIEYGRGGTKVSAEMREALDNAKAAEQAAEVFDVSPRSVEAAVFVHRHGTEEEVASLSNPKTKITSVEKTVRDREKATSERKPLPKFNETTESIEWAKWTWNPVTGCNHGCTYCYARDIALRYPDAFPNGFNPTFYENRLSAPYNTKQPSDNATIGERNVFVCSMADLFGDWVPTEWIRKVLDVCRKTPQWNYLFLTKNPKRYIGLEWPDNAWVGATADTRKRFFDACEVFSKITASVKFISCEPLSEQIFNFGENEGQELYGLPDWIIIGGRSRTTGSPAMQPEWEWVEGILTVARMNSIQVYFKPNLTVRPREYPEG